LKFELLTNVNWRVFNFIFIVICMPSVDNEYLFIGLHLPSYNRNRLP
jgi:hypothetical protein